MFGRPAIEAATARRNGNGMDQASTAGPLISIGALARATGIPAATLRTWERRYGFPRPVRLDSGHRRYRTQDAVILERIRDLLAEGHRAADVLGADADAIRALSAFSRTHAEGSDADAPTSNEEAAPATVTPLRPRNAATPVWDDVQARDALLDAVMALDGQRLQAGLATAWETHGALAAIERVVGPLLGEIGERWRNGRLEILHEHFASEQLRDFLVQHWRGLSARARVRVVATTLPGERHVLGLHICATVLATSGVGSVFLGTETPLVDVVGAVETTGAIAVAVSISSATAAQRARAQLEELRDALPPSVTLLVGGAGADATILPRGVRHVHDLASLADWGTSRRLEREPSAGAG